MLEIKTMAAFYSEFLNFFDLFGSTCGTDSVNLQASLMDRMKQASRWT
jgi:hypothetical protein